MVPSLSLKKYNVLQTGYISAIRRKYKTYSENYKCQETTVEISSITCTVLLTDIQIKHKNIINWSD